MEALFARSPSLPVSPHTPFYFLQDAKVMSWWDYGYQITAMANRTILVDNNTWNNTHISRVGQVTTALFTLVLFTTYNHLFSWNEDKYVCMCVGDGVFRGEGLRDHERAGRQLRVGDLRRTHRIFIRRYGGVKTPNKI